MTVPAFRRRKAFGGRHDETPPGPAGTSDVIVDSDPLGRFRVSPVVRFRFASSERARSSASCAG